MQGLVLVEDLGGGAAQAGAGRCVGVVVIVCGYPGILVSSQVFWGHRRMPVGKFSYFKKGGREE